MRSKVVVALLVLGCVVVVCSRNGAKKFYCEPKLRSHGDDCIGAFCPKNSPFTNLFPVNGVSVDDEGRCNADGIGVVPQSLAGPSCPEGSSLEFERAAGRLVGKKDGDIVCERSALAGATFSITRGDYAVRLKIAEVRIFDEPGESYEGYRIERATGGGDVCDYKVSRDVLADLGYTRPKPEHDQYLPVPSGYQAGANDDLVVAIGGGIFDVRDADLIDSLDPKKFFNLACVGDALAKAKFERIGDRDDAQRRTALHMLTANYCGRHLTVRGMKIDWEPRVYPMRPGDLPSGKRIPEARWRNGRAICIETPRLMELAVEGKEVPLSPKELPRYLQPRGCVNHGAGTNGGNCDKDAWETALQADCEPLPLCPTISDRGDLTSFVFSATN